MLYVIFLASILHVCKGFGARLKFRDFWIIWCLASLEAILRLLEPKNRIPATLQEQKIDVYFGYENWNGHGILELNRTDVERRQLKLTEKGKAHRLVERTKVRKWLEGEVQSLIDNIGTLMGLDKNLVVVD